MNDLNTPQSATLARALIRDIQSGRYAPGAKLESVRVLAERYGVGRQVVLSAFGRLLKQNFVCSEARKGFFVSAKLERGFFYRLGFFENRNNPASSRMAFELYYLARRYGWTLVEGSNFETNGTIADFLAEKTDIDGVLVSGIMDPGLLKTLLHGTLPYVIIGNYGLDERYEQVHYDGEKELYQGLTDEIRKERIGSLCAICGPEQHYNERLNAGVIRRAIADAGLDAERSGVFHAPADGCPEIVKSMRRKPDAIFFLGEHCLGYRKYREQHAADGEGARPRIWITSRWSRTLLPGEYDAEIVLLNNETFEEHAILRILELIHAKKTTVGTKGTKK